MCQREFTLEVSSGFVWVGKRSYCVVLISWDVTMALSKYPSWVVQDRTLSVSKYFYRNTGCVKYILQNNSK